MKLLTNRCNLAYQRGAKNFIAVYRFPSWISLQNFVDVLTLRWWSSVRTECKGFIYLYFFSCVIICLKIYTFRIMTNNGDYRLILLFRDLCWSHGSPLIVPPAIYMTHVNLKAKMICMVGFFPRMKVFSPNIYQLEFRITDAIIPVGPYLL